MRKVVKSGRIGQLTAWWIYESGVGGYVIDIIHNRRNVCLTARSLEQAEAMVKEYIANA